MIYISDKALENHYSRNYYGEGTDYFYPWGWDENGIPLDEPIYDDLAEVEKMSEIYYLIKIKSGWKWEYTFATTDSEKALKLANDLMEMHVEDVDDKGEPMEFKVSVDLVENDEVVDLSESEDNF